MDFSPYSAYLSHLLMQGLEVTGCHKAEYEIILNVSHWVDSKYIHLPQLSSSFYGAFSAHLCFLILSNVCQPEPSSCRGLAKDHSMSCILNKKPPNLVAVKDALSGCWLHLLLASWNVSSAVTCSLASKMLARKKNLPDAFKILKNAHELPVTGFISLPVWRRNICLMITVFLQAVKSCTCVILAWEDLCSQELVLAGVVSDTKVASTLPLLPVAQGEAEDGSCVLTWKGNAWMFSLDSLALP